LPGWTGKHLPAPASVQVAQLGSGNTARFADLVTEAAGSQ